MKKSIITLAITVLAITGCSNKSNLENTVPIFGVWQVNERTCMLESTREDIKLQTDGRMSADYAYFKLTSTLPLARTPSIAANNSLKNVI